MKSRQQLKEIVLNDDELKGKIERIAGKDQKCFMVLIDQVSDSCIS